MADPPNRARASWSVLFAVGAVAEVAALVFLLIWFGFGRGLTYFLAAMAAMAGVAIVIAVVKGAHSR